MAVLFLQVLEGWLQWAAMGVMQHAQAAQAVLVLVKNLGAKLHDAGKVGWSEQLLFRLVSAGLLLWCSRSLRLVYVGTSIQQQLSLNSGAER
jgi:hypothetical protein